MTLMIKVQTLVLMKSEMTDFNFSIVNQNLFSLFWKNLSCDKPFWIAYHRTKKFEIQFLFFLAFQ